MDLQAEYNDFLTGLGDAGSAFYKFFDLFRISLGDAPEEGITRGIHYGKSGYWYDLTDEQLRGLKTYMKAQKSWVRKQQKNADKAECRRRMWFWVQKLIEFGAFDRSTRRDIMYWMDTCIERTFEGCEVRLFSRDGEPAFARKMDDK